MSRQVAHQFPVSGEEINFRIDIHSSGFIHQYHSSGQPKKTDVHQFVQQKRVDMQKAHEAARCHLQVTQLRRYALYISKTHGQRYKPVDSVW